MLKVQTLRRPAIVHMRREIEAKLVERPVMQKVAFHRLLDHFLTQKEKILSHTEHVHIQKD